MNEDLLLLSIVLTQSLNSVNNLRAANLTLHQAAHMNKASQPEDLQHFLILMEVYGSVQHPSHFEPAIISLEMQRRYAMNELTTCSTRLKDAVNRLTKESKNGPPDV